MDFFEAQARAKKRTSRLVVLFGLAVAGTIAALYFVAIFTAGATGSERSSQRRHRSDRRYVSADAFVLWQPLTLLYVAAGTLAVVGLASLYKWSQFAGGGAAVAASLGARRVDPRSTEFNERRLLNVVEEMAIASGVPVPAVFVLPDEPALNAFAAGLTTSDAAVCVTRGTLEKLNRDELQGVVAHEFSHILNGDMRLNVRIAAIVFGILVIGLAGRGILWSLRGARVRGGKNSGGVVAGIMLLGVALLVIGYVGYFFGRLIQAAVSRQREFLADASAVQFTRNPGGITGALKKIGGYALGSSLQTAKAAEIGHFFFAQGFTTWLGGVWDTHPPLAERIRAIDPSFDGQMFAPPEVVDITRESFATAGFSGPRHTPDETARRVFSAAAVVPPPRPAVRLAYRPAAAIAQVGALTESHFQRAQSLLDAIPDALLDAARDGARAPVVVYGLLFTGPAETRAVQQQLVERHGGTAAAATLAALRAPLSLVDPAARLPLLQICLPALRQLDAAALERFVTTLDELVHADQSVTPFEFALQKMLLHSLALGRAPSAGGVQIHSFHAVTTEIAAVLSALAHASGGTADAATHAFASGAAQLKLIEEQLALLPADRASLVALDGALDKLATASFPIKQRTLVAAAHTIGADGEISVAEGELLRAIAATLDCPMPPLQAA